MASAVQGGGRDFAAQVRAIVDRAGDASAMTTEDLAQSRKMAFFGIDQRKVPHLCALRK